MAYVSTAQIKRTLNLSIDYAAGHKKEGGAVFATLSSGINCTVKTAYEVSRALELFSKATRGQKRIRTKDGEEVVGWHFQQDFKESPEELDPETAHEIGVRLAEELFGENFPCVVGTHRNTGHVHNHIIIGAWGMDGKKHNNSNGFYQKLRETSDRLCGEYGLHVLEETRKVSLARWRDETGGAHSFEPTARKAKAREKKRYAKAGDYRDTGAYETRETARAANAGRIQGDIDRLVSEAGSYEQLLDMLRGMGYEIRDKNAGGGWLKNISFKAPGQGRATRDCKLGDGEYYTRASLEKTIEALATRRLAAELAAAAGEAGAPPEEPDITGKWQAAKAAANGAPAAGGGAARLIKLTVLYGDGAAKSYQKLPAAERRQYRARKLTDRINASIRSLTVIGENGIASAGDLAARTRELRGKKEAGTITAEETRKLADYRHVAANLRRIERKGKGGQHPKEEGGKRGR
jgi:hypothetical protein